MSNSNSFTISNESITLCVNDRPYVADSSHRNYWAIRSAAIEGNYDLAVKLLDIAGELRQAVAGTNISIQDGEVYYFDNPIHNTATEALLSILEEANRLGIKANIDPMVRFLDRLMQNPSFRAVQELWGFLSATHMTILPDGRFVAYKKVRELENGHLVDIYTEKFSNDIGTIVEVPRNQVDENPNQTCSYGLHVCSEGYLNVYGTGESDICVIVAVDPADVVAVPTDYNNAKMRVCRYEVLGKRRLSEEINYHTPVSEFNSVIFDTDSYWDNNDDCDYKKKEEDFFNEYDDDNDDKEW